MAFSMHSHSGQFCPGHAKDSLEEVVQTAIARGMTTFALTEHMPRMQEEDLYPEEVKAGDSIDNLHVLHDGYVQEAVRLRQRYAEEITLLIGFEGEWVRPSYANLIQKLASKPEIDFFIGSVHHVHGIPIDYDANFYSKARDAAGGTDERLFEDYFDAQYEMLQALTPRVVGHFDLIRLLSDDPDGDLKDMEGVWSKVIRNLQLIVKQGGLMEINSAALRKGLKEPYPSRRICEEFLDLGGKLTLSDDSHGVIQVGTNYTRTIEYLEALKVDELYTLEQRGDSTKSSPRPIALSSVKQSFRPSD